MLHLSEDLAPAEALAYARSVEAGWVALAGGDGSVELTDVSGGAETEVLSVGEVAGRVKGEARGAVR